MGVVDMKVDNLIEDDWRSSLAGATRHNISHLNLTGLQAQTNSA